jgi:hypothetical protein
MTGVKQGEKSNAYLDETFASRFGVEARKFDRRTVDHISTAHLWKPSKKG